MRHLPSADFPGSLRLHPATSNDSLAPRARPGHAELGYDGAGPKPRFPWLVEEDNGGGLDMVTGMAAGMGMGVGMGMGSVIGANETPTGGIIQSSSFAFPDP